MHFRYRVAAVVALLAVPLVVRTEAPPPGSPVVTHPAAPAAIDPRITRLQAFFAKLHCPAVEFAEDFITAADDNNLDWRLLPSISVVESGGGKAFRNNNIFGWNNGAEAFPSLRAGIHAVAFALGQSRLYQNRNLPEKLWLYNPDEGYVQTVLAVMHRISPTEKLTLASRASQF